MEVVLQWWDDLDDLVFVAVAMAERLRDHWLPIGLAAAAGLAVAELEVMTPAWSPAGAAAAASGAGLWLTAAACRLFARFAPRRAA
ncbi:MAG TPA: hypothetical protein VIN61_05900 [Gammaproteobacteria bacterium]